MLHLQELSLQSVLCVAIQFQVCHEFYYSHSDDQANLLANLIILLFASI